MQTEVILLFPSCDLDALYFLAWLLCLIFPALYWTEVAWVGSLVFFLIGKAFNFSALSIMLARSCMAFIMLKSSIYTSLIENFYYERVLNFVKFFFCIYCNDHMVLHFQLVRCITIKVCIYLFILTFQG